MIAVKLQGGLGNQMFQYAIGRYLSLKLNCKLYLDIDAFKKENIDSNTTPRHFELDIFKLEYRKYTLVKDLSLFQKLYNRFFPVQFIQESSFKYQPQIQSLKGNLYLDGYWQNENYFKSIAYIIREDFSFQLPLLQEIEEIKKSIELSNAVSIHFRRSDYITNTNANQFHGVCTEQYYEDAIAIMQEKIAIPHFFIFSDELDWVKENFKIKGKYSLVNTNSKAWIDMYLMSICKHHIIANSSFSWWGAWLNPHEDKIVIAPSIWFRGAETDIIPKEWIRL